MTYSAVYCALVSKRLHNPLPQDVYGEVHHIIPKSEGGSNGESNLVRLSAREHYIAHLLLAKIYKDVKMYSAITYMRTGRIDGRKFNINSRLYQIIRERFGRLSSEAQRGCKAKWYGRHHTDETKRKISKANTGRVFSE